MPWTLIAASASLACRPSLARRRDGLSTTLSGVRAGAWSPYQNGALVAWQVGGLRHGGNVGRQRGSFVLPSWQGPSSFAGFDMYCLTIVTGPKNVDDAATQDIDHLSVPKIDSGILVVKSTKDRP